MTIALEREFKNPLTQAEFQRILNQYDFAPVFIQSNRYFDTLNGELKQRHMGLRIRCFETYGEQTLKVPYKDSNQDHALTEITDPLTLTQAQAGKLQTSGQVNNYLKKIGLPLNMLQPLGLITTKRHQCALPIGLLVLDETTFPDHTTDYEIELETQQAKHSIALDAWLKQLAIPQRPSLNKIQRLLQHQKSTV